MVHQSLSEYLILESIHNELQLQLECVCSPHFDPNTVRQKVDNCFNDLIEIDLQTLNHVELAKVQQIYSLTNTILELVTERWKLFEELKQFEREQTTGKKNSVRFTTSQKSILNFYYEISTKSHLDPKACEKIAEETKLTIKQVKNWFSQKNSRSIANESEF